MPSLPDRESEDQLAGVSRSLLEPCLRPRARYRAIGQHHRSLDLPPAVTVSYVREIKNRLRTMRVKALRFCRPPDCFPGLLIISYHEGEQNKGTSAFGPPVLR